MFDYSNVNGVGNIMPYQATIKSVLDDRVIYSGRDFNDYVNVLSSCSICGFSISISYEKA